MTKNLLSSLMTKPKNTKLNARKFVKMLNSAYQNSNTNKEFNTYGEEVVPNQPNPIHT